MTEQEEQDIAFEAGSFAMAASIALPISMPRIYAGFVASILVVCEATGRSFDDVLAEARTIAASRSVKARAFFFQHQNEINLIHGTKGK